MLLIKVSVIVQAQTAHNEPIREGTKLALAYEKWKKKYVLQEMPKKLYDEDDLIFEALPF